MPALPLVERISQRLPSRILSAIHFALLAILLCGCKSYWEEQSFTGEQLQARVFMQLRQARDASLSVTFSKPSGAPMATNSVVIPHSGFWDYRLVSVESNSIVLSLVGRGDKNLGTVRIPVEGKASFSK